MNLRFITIIVNVIIGTICIVCGVNLMGSSLEKANISRMKRYLSALTNRLPLAVITGTVLTALVQSSTAITVITVGLVNSGMLKLTQAVGIIYGANIGTTITAQLMSFRLTNTAYIIIALGLLTTFIAKKSKRHRAPSLLPLSLHSKRLNKSSGHRALSLLPLSLHSKRLNKQSLANMGWALTGLGIMFAGLNILNSGVPYIRESQEAYELFKTYGQNPLIGLFIGMVTTMLVQSSSATVGLTIVLFNTGLIGFESALGLTLGDNIGTCITAQFASIGTSISAKRTAWAHTLYNVIGVIIALILLEPFSVMVQAITYGVGQDETRLIANAHTIFNILSAIIFLPITGYYVKFLNWLIKEK